VKTAVPSRTHKKAAAAVCTGAEQKQSQKRTALRQPRISPGDLFHSLQAQLSTLATVHLSEAKQTFCSIIGSSKRVAYLYSHRKVLGRMGAIFSLGTAAIVGIATVRSTPEVSVVTAVPTQTEIIQATKPEAAVAPKPITGPTIAPMPLIGEFGFSLGSAEQSIPAIKAKELLAIKAKEPLATPKPESMPSPAQAAIAETPESSPAPTAVRKEFVEIAVELKIEDGRVAEAHVGKKHSKQPHSTLRDNAAILQELHARKHSFYG
jgi:hypothetical protein